MPKAGVVYIDLAKREAHITRARASRFKRADMWFTTRVYRTCVYLERCFARVADRMECEFAFLDRTRFQQVTDVTGFSRSRASALDLKRAHGGAAGAEKTGRVAGGYHANEIA